MVIPSEENARTLLSIAEQRRQHWANAIDVATGLAVTVNIAIWTFFIKEFLDNTSLINNETSQPFAFSYIIFAAGLSALVLGVWRYYVHEHDNAIANVYPDILFYEQILNVPHDMGIRKYLSEGNSNFQTYLLGLCPEQELEAVKNLVKTKSIGRRGHLKWNLWVFFFDVVFVGLIVGGAYSPYGHWDIPSLLKSGQWLSYPLLLIAGVGVLLTLAGIVIQIIAFNKAQKCTPLKREKSTK
jgi:hypothetical protein